MNTDLWRLIFEIFQFVLTGGTCFYVYLSNKDKVTNDRIGKLEDDLDEKLDGHAERIVKLESGTATHSDLSDIHEKINGVSAEISTLSGEFRGVRNLLETLHRHLLNGGKP